MKPKPVFFSKDSVDRDRASFAATPIATMIEELPAAIEDVKAIADNPTWDEQVSELSQRIQNEGLPINIDLPGANLFLDAHRKMLRMSVFAESIVRHGEEAGIDTTPIAKLIDTPTPETIPDALACARRVAARLKRCDAPVVADKDENDEPVAVRQAARELDINPGVAKRLADAGTLKRYGNTRKISRASLERHKKLLQKADAVVDKKVEATLMQLQDAPRNTSATLRNTRHE